MDGRILRILCLSDGDLDLLFVPRVLRGAGLHSCMKTARWSCYMNLMVLSHPVYSRMVGIVWLTWDPAAVDKSQGNLASYDISKYHVI